LALFLAPHKFIQDNVNGSRTYQLILQKLQFLPDDSITKQNTTASLTKTHNNVAKNVTARGTSTENATVASTSKNTEHSASMDSTAAIAKDTGNKNHLPPAGKGKRKAIDPAAGLSKQGLRAGGVIWK
jgi:hypothetical protein